MSKYLVGLPFSPFAKKVGYETEARKKVEEKRARRVVSREKRLISDGKSFLASYESLPSEQKTVLHYRDLLIAEAVPFFVVNCQYRDKERNFLSLNARRVWENYSFDDFWTYVPPRLGKVEEVEKYWGELGSLAFYAKYLDQSKSLPEILYSLLELFWALLGLSINQPPQERINILKTRLDLDSEFLTNVSNKIKLMFQAKEGDRYYPELLAARQNLIFADDYDYLLQKIMIGNYRDGIFDIVSGLLEPKEFKRLSSILANCLDFLKPAGFSLVLQALAAEGYLQAAFFITQNQDLHFSNLAKVQSDIAMKDFAVEVAARLALSYDALAWLRTQSVKGSDEVLSVLSSAIISWLSVSGSVIAPDNYWRLEDFLPVDF